MKTLPLHRGSRELVGLRRALRLSREEQARPLELPQSTEAARFWSERAWAEYAAVPAMAQVALALVRETTNLDGVAAVTAIAADEVVHTELSRGLADGFGGYVADIPDHLPYEPDRVADISDDSPAMWVMGTAISETVSLALMRARLRHTRHPTVKAILRRVYRDELVHARAGWSLAQALIPQLSESDRKDLGGVAESFFESLGTSFATAGLPADVRADARRLRDVTADLGLGAAPADEEDAVCIATILDQVVPRLTRLGVSTSLI